jgi:mannosyltransferase OCH1-like enzyme
MIIHQIFFKVSDKTFDDYPCYAEGMAKWKALCEEQGWEYKLHTDIDKSIMTQEEIDICEEGTRRYPFFPVDYYRYIFLCHYGGMYVDLDVFPTDDFKLIMNNDIILVRAREDNWVNNDVIKLPKELIEELKQFAHKQFYEKCNIEVYNTWRKRFLLHSVGPCMITKFCKMKKLVWITDYNKYFKDHNTQAWDKF